MTPRAFQRIVWGFYKEHARSHLPWRRKPTPYRVLVSEVMLQQTQVDRVVPYFNAWMKRFSTVRTLGAAPLHEVLRHWQGLGYNRRAKNLHAAAKALSKLRTFPKTVRELEALPGIGPYTARAIGAFAHNQDVVLIETNTRTVVMHHFCKGKKNVTDTEIAKVLERVLPKGKARAWYAALMDYGSHLKRSGVRLNQKTRGYTRQSTFRGSTREARGVIMKALAKGPQKGSFLVSMLGEDRKDQMRSQLTALTKEGFAECSRGRFRLPG